MEITLEKRIEIYKNLLEKLNTPGYSHYLCSLLILTNEEFKIKISLEDLPELMLQKPATAQICWFYDKDVPNHYKLSYNQVNKSLRELRVQCVKAALKLAEEN